MCSIFGVLGRPEDIDYDLFDSLRRDAGDRGRDGGGHEQYELDDGRVAILGNWRAIPTPELADAPYQPYDGIVHNGTIANDKELGVGDDEVDSWAIARYVSREDLDSYATDLLKLKGAYATASVAANTVLAACNYKPLHYWSPDGGRTTYFSSMRRHFEAVLPRGQAAVKLSPYTAIDLTTGETRDLRTEPPKRAVVIASAGLDSTYVAAKLVNEGYEVCLLHFRYGCHAEGQEARLIPTLAEDLGCTYHILDLPMASISTNSPLLQKGADIAKGADGAEYAHEWVPARNLLMLGVAAAFAEGNGYHYIALGNNLEEAGAYPDNEEEMTIIFDDVCNYAVQNGYTLRVLMPVGHLMKHEIVREGVAIGTPFHHTYSCYRGEAEHCGNCGPCFMRRTAFDRNGLVDPVFGGRSVP